MKYWRGYIVALILAAGTWALRQFAKTHAALVDMVYPYMTRLIQSYLAQWSAGVSFCLWQLGLLALVAVLLASVVLMIVRRQKFVRWLGWVLAGVSFLVFLNTGMYSLNRYAGSLAEDVRLEVTQYTVKELVDAATYYRDKANELSAQVGRNADGSAQYPEFEALAEQAGEGFRIMTYEHSASVLSGSRVPVKKLNGLGALSGVAGLTVGITGESAVNPKVPAVAQPWIMCREMAHRMSIVNSDDANLAAYLTCLNNPAPEFQYSANLIAYQFCLEGLKTVSSGAGDVRQLEAGEDRYVRTDLEAYRDYFGSGNRKDTVALCDQLVSWHLQEIVLPTKVDEKPVFDPFDPNQVDLSGIVNAKNE